MDQQAQENVQRKRLKGCACSAIGCGLPLLTFILMVASFVWHVGYYHEFGENQASAPEFNAEKGTDFSYDVTYSWSYIEFTISEPDFLDWCRQRNWKPVEIKDLPSLPKVESDWEKDSDWPRINGAQGDKGPFSIPRYSYKKPEHERCNKYDHNQRCQIDPTGKTDDACFRSVDDGYYYETRQRSAGGFHILYDRENNRCYIQANPR